MRMYLSQPKVCTQKAELALEVKFYGSDEVRISADQRK